MTQINQAITEVDSKILIVDDDPSLLRLLGIRYPRQAIKLNQQKMPK